jgi:hypothetical protein
MDTQKHSFAPSLRLAATVLLGLLLNSAGASDITVSSPRGGLSLQVDEGSGAYRIVVEKPAWTFGGSLGSSITNAAVARGRDSVGDYQQITFEWRDGPLPMTGKIRLYDEEPLALFSDKCKVATEMPASPFPSFTNLPENLHTFSYRQETFAPPQFAASECSTPWLLFDDRADALVISPASHFMVASMIGDGRQKMASGFDGELRNLPAGFTQQTILAFGHGINRTLDRWGYALTRLDGVKRPGNEADTVLKYLGYWTDNGAYYYYNYDTNQGYAGTLQSLVEHYRQEQIPIRYLQLDSWWYYKTLTGPDGKIGKPKSSKLPEGEWNRYGGLLKYEAHPFLFPKGLAAFQKSIGLPLVTHDRWIDPASPYHEKYKISGLAAVDPKWWADITAYLKSCGVTTYEQDWCDRIYKYSPAFSGTVDTAEAFLNDMADACQKRGITMQYCMPYPCFFLQGSCYKNLTTIRVSEDGFEPGKWNNFLYVSRLASALGIWPWSDVFNSTETNNLLLSTLSAGPVGIGDEMGKEEKPNLLRAVRADGVIVKPDVPIVPLDRSYIADAQHDEAPLIAGTFTRHGDIKTEYVFAFNRPGAGRGEVQFTPAELGFTNSVYIYDYFSATARLWDADALFAATLDGNAPAFYIVAPVGRSGIAFLGDKDKFVSTGRQRIASLQDEPGGLTVKVIFAAPEKSVTLHGYAATAPEVTVQSGRAGPVEYDEASRHFSVEISPGSTSPISNVGGDPVRTVTVKFQTGAKSVVR